MTDYVVGATELKEWVDAMVAKGAMAFIVSTRKDGNASIPSKRVPVYRIPCAIHSDIFQGEPNLSKVIGGSRVVLPVDDLDWLSPEARKKYEESVERYGTQSASGE